jgi:hypothetical protein
MSKASGFLYGISRKIGKIAGTMNTIETIASGDPAKIVKHFGRKMAYKGANKVVRKITR